MACSGIALLPAIMLIGELEGFSRRYNNHRMCVAAATSPAVKV